MECQINGEQVTVAPGTTVLDAARDCGIQIPTMCHVEGLCATGACRLCVVELEGRAGLVPACSTAVWEGMAVCTHSHRVIEARRVLVELLLAHHGGDCPTCVRSSDCELRRLADELGVTERRREANPNRGAIDLSNPAIVREPAKCVLCGRCVRVCDEVQGIGAIDFAGRGRRARVAAAFDEGLGSSPCIHCGQCVAVCPTGALSEQDHLSRVESALADPALHVVVQHAPAVSVSLGELFGLPPGADVAGHLTAALRRLGFERVLDTSFAADLTVMEEASELVKRLTGDGPLPLLTSCSPGWVRFLEASFPHRLDNLSTCKSPQQMLGALAKTHLADREGWSPDRIFSVAIMPCTAKKAEAQRPEMVRSGRPDIDAVLTTRELARLLKGRGILLDRLEPEGPDTLFGERSSAGKLFGGSGGVMEAALRTGHFLVTGEELPVDALALLRGAGNRREAQVAVGDVTLGVAVVSGLAEARKLMTELDEGRTGLHFIEVMTCPGGCINGGGQPRGLGREEVAARQEALYAIDERAGLRTAHENGALQRLYAEFLGTPLSRRSHELLHTTYQRR